MRTASQCGTRAKSNRHLQQSRTVEDGWLVSLKHSVRGSELFKVDLRFGPEFAWWKWGRILVPVGAQAFYLEETQLFFWRWSQRENCLREESFKQYKFMVWDSHSWKDPKQRADVVLSDEDRPCSQAAWEDVFRRVSSLWTPLSPSLSLLQFADGLWKMSMGYSVKIVIGIKKDSIRKEKYKKYKRKTKQIQKEMLFYNHDIKKRQSPVLTGCGEVAVSLISSADGKIKWYDCFGKLFDVSSKVSIQPRHPTDRLTHWREMRSTAP